MPVSYHRQPSNTIVFYHLTGNLEPLTGKCVVFAAVGVDWMEENCCGGVESI